MPGLSTVREALGDSVPYSEPLIERVYLTELLLRGASKLWWMFVFYLLITIPLYSCFISA
jgi:hypothetical protein